MEIIKKLSNFRLIFIISLTLLFILIIHSVFNHYNNKNDDIYNNIPGNNKYINQIKNKLNNDDKKIDSLNKQISILKDSLYIINNKLDDNNIKYKKLKKEYEKNYRNIDSYNAKQISSYFSKRYSK
jgi:peptidoglycan hydrolase CwlO-like protein